MQCTIPALSCLSSELNFAFYSLGVITLRDAEVGDFGGDQASGAGAWTRTVAGRTEAVDGSEPLSGADGVSDFAGGDSGGGDGAEPQGREDQHRSIVERLGKGEEEAGKKAVTGGVCAGRTVQRRDICDAVWELGKHPPRRQPPRHAKSARVGSPGH